MQKLIAKVWICDFGHHYHFLASPEFIRELTEILAKVDIEFVLQTENIIPQCDIDKHDIIAIIKSVYEVQGMEWHEGQDCFKGIESLVVKYLENRCTPSP